MFYTIPKEAVIIFYNKFKLISLNLKSNHSKTYAIFMYSGWRLPWPCCHHPPCCLGSIHWPRHHSNCWDQAARDQEAAQVLWRWTNPWELFPNWYSCSWPFLLRTQEEVYELCPFPGMIFFIQFLGKFFHPNKRRSTQRKVNYII